jgi:hypothetical protein
LGDSLLLLCIQHLQSIAVVEQLGFGKYAKPFVLL